MIAVGIDTHKDTHMAVALSGLGELLGEISVDAAIAGYQEVDRWLDGLAEGDEPISVGIEGAGSWGAGLCEYLTSAGREVFEVERPTRKARRNGKSDRIDALEAAKAVLAGRGLSTPRACGVRRAIAAVLLAQRGAVAERTRLLNQLQSLLVTAPIDLRESVGEGKGQWLERRLCSMRPRKLSLEQREVFGVMRDLAKRARDLRQAARRYEQRLKELILSLDETLLDGCGMGPITVAQLLVADPRRFKNEQAFARCNGTAPIEASSGKTVRHRLNRGGDRQTNASIHVIALTRLRHDEESRAYFERRVAEGKSRREAMRSLKRHISRRMFKRMREVPLTN